MRIIFILTLAILLFAHGVAFATVQAGPIQFDSDIQLKEVDMRLLGAGMKTFFIFDLVSVGLYVEDDSDKADVLTDVPKRLEVNYLQNIRKREVQKQTTKGIKNNTTLEEYREMLPRVEKMNSFFPDIQPFDMISVTYIPGRGSTVAVNNEIKGVIEGEDFARAFFAIWVGPDPVDQKIKEKLLGRR